MEEKSKSKGKKEITISDIKKCKGFENLTDDEAKEVIQDLESLAKLIISIMKQNNQI